MERRATRRSEINVTLSCRAPARPCRAVLNDVSHVGCCLRIFGSHVELGATALIDLPSASQWAGRVVWADGDTVGIRFDWPLRTTTATALGLDEPVSPQTY